MMVWKLQPEHLITISNFIIILSLFLVVLLFYKWFHFPINPMSCYINGTSSQSLVIKESDCSEVTVWMLKRCSHWSESSTLKSLRCVSQEVSGLPPVTGLTVCHKAPHLLYLLSQLLSFTYVTLQIPEL